MLGSTWEQIICCWGFHSQTTQMLVISRSCLSEDSEEMYKVLKGMC